jgi:hypothetical protein
MTPSTHQIARTALVTHQRCDLLDPVLASGASAPLSQQAALGAQASEARIGMLPGPVALPASRCGRSSIRVAGRCRSPASPATAGSSPSTGAAMAAQITRRPDVSAAIEEHLAKLG